MQWTPERIISDARSVDVGFERYSRCVRPISLAGVILPDLALHLQHQAGRIVAQHLADAAVVALNDNPPPCVARSRVCDRAIIAVSIAFAQPHRSGALLDIARDRPIELVVITAQVITARVPTVHKIVERIVQPQGSSRVDARGSQRTAEHVVVVGQSKEAAGIHDCREHAVVAPPKFRHTVLPGRGRFKGLDRESGGAEAGDLGRSNMR